MKRLTLFALVLLTLTGCKWPWESDDKAAATEPETPLAVGASLDLDCDSRTRPIVKCGVILSGVAPEVDKQYRVVASGLNDAETTTRASSWNVSFDYTEPCDDLGGAALDADFSAEVRLPDNSSVKTTSAEQHQVCVINTSFAYQGNRILFDGDAGEIVLMGLEGSLAGLITGERFEIRGSDHNDGVYTAASPSTDLTIVVREPLQTEMGGNAVTLSRPFSNP